MIILGTGAGQERYILSHTATTFTLKTNWTTNPDGTSQFLVTGPGTTILGTTLADIFGSSTIGNSGLARTVNADAGFSVWIISGTGAGQNRQITANTATTYTVSPAFAVNPDATSRFVVTYRVCPKDHPSCAARGVVERFSGILFLQPLITTVNGPTGVGTGGPRPSGGGNSGDRGGRHRTQ